MPADLILYAVVAAGLVFWLKNILGTRHGEERDRANPFSASSATEPQKDESASEAEVHAGQFIDMHPVPFTDTEVLPANASIETDTAKDGLEAIAKADRAFTTSAFLQGAQDAFVMIVEAFAEGDLDTLKNLLDPRVYSAFEAVILERRETGEQCLTEIHAIRHVDVTDAVLKGTEASITLRFTADETCVIKDADGDILRGDPDKVTTMIDLWTFARSVKSKDPKWLLVRTDDGDVVEDHKTPLPDSHA